METKHTPSPWEVKEGYDKDSGLKLHRVVFGTSIVAECYGVNSNDNARLIAAAPELLATLKSLAWLQVGDQLGSSDVEAIRTAIAKWDEATQDWTTEY